MDAGFTPSYDYALQTLKEIPYARWREYNPEDAIRFYSLLAARSGHDQVKPEQDLLADGTDWRHWNELKRELKSCGRIRKWMKDGRCPKVSTSRHFAATRNFGPLSGA